MGAHSDLGPSSSGRWINCTNSVSLCADMPEDSSTFAQEGTDAHALCEYLLKKELGQEAEDPRENLSYYNEEMQECAEGYVEYVMGLVNEAKKACSDVVCEVEQRISYERFVHGGFGTADCIIIADGTLNVVDYKYGQGVEVNAIGNTQMRIYALGALEIYDLLYDIDRVHMTIYQPRLSNISEDEISRNELYDWAVGVLEPAAKEARSGNGKFACGDWCRFCKARHVCRERAKENLKMAAYDFASPPLLTDEEITDILGKVDALIQWANDVKEYALQEAVDGKKWSGYKLVEGRSIRKYTDEAAVAAAVEAAGYEAFDKKLKTITEMQKQLGRKKFEEVLGGLVIKPQGKPSLVRQDDKRPEFNTAKADFKEEKL